MLRTVLSLLLFLSIARPAQAQMFDWTRHLADHDVFIYTMGAYTAASAWDAKGTTDCVSAGVCHEANPVLRPIVDAHGIGTAMTVKLGAQAGLAIAHMYWRKHQPLLAGCSMVGLTAAQIYVDIRNERTLARARQP